MYGVLPLKGLIFEIFANFEKRMIREIAHFKKIP